MDLAVRLGLGEPGLFAAAWEGEDAIALGWARELQPEGAEAVLRGLADQLLELFAAQREPAERLSSRLAHFGPLDAASHAVKRARLSQATSVAEDRRAALGTAAAAHQRPPPGTCPAGKWPTKLRRSLDGADGPRAREMAEATDRARWAQKAGELVSEANLPLHLVAARTADPERTLLQVAQGLRALTLRKRVRDWAKARSFFMLAHSAPWPTHEGMVIDYIQTLAGEGVSKSAAWDFMGALKFLEKGGGVQPDASYSENAAVKAAIAEIRAAPAKGPLRERKKAPRFFAAMIPALERQVLDDQSPTYTRMYAWWKLLKVYGCLRFDDHRGIQPATLLLGPTGLSTTLTRTKTSGSGKTRETMPLVVSAGTDTTGHGWLSMGLDLWAEHGAPRDYLLMLPARNLEGAIPVEAKYPDAVAMSRACLARLKTQDNEPLFVNRSLASFWMEHSERATLPSWCGCLTRYPSDWVDLLGRWGAGRSETYVRTHRHRVHMMQKDVSGIIAGGSHWQTFEEEDLMAELTVYMQAAGYSDTDISRQAALLGRPDPSRDVPTEVNDSPANPFEEDTSSIEDNIDDGAAATEVAEPTKIPGLGDFVVCIRRSSKRRTLHLVGACHRRPGVSYDEYKGYGSERPASSHYTVVCKQCWPTGAPVTELEEVITDDESTSSSDER
jgi:hypothetical protein